MASLTTKKRESRGTPKVSLLHHWEEIGHVAEGETPARYFDDEAGMAKARESLRAQAVRGGFKVSKITAETEWSDKRGTYLMHYSCEVLGHAAAK